VIEMTQGTRVINRVPDLLVEAGAGPMDLVRKAGLAQGTAYRLADRKQEVEAVTFDVLGRLAKFFSERLGREVSTSDIFPLAGEGE